MGKQENGASIVRVPQSEVWDRSHRRRAWERFFNPEVRYAQPTPSALLLEQYLPPHRLMKILEIGSGYGMRDALYFADRGHRVHTIDFSEIVHKRNSKLADRLHTELFGKHGRTYRVSPQHAEIIDGKLPFIGTYLIDTVYARSSVYGDDEMVERLTQSFDARMTGYGTVMIVGKTANDESIKRSVPTGRSNLVVDLRDGHVRRVWSGEFMEGLAERRGWQVLDIAETQETIRGRDARFVHLIARKDGEAGADSPKFFVDYHYEMAKRAKASQS